MTLSYEADFFLKKHVNHLRSEVERTLALPWLSCCLKLVEYWARQDMCARHSIIKRSWILKTYSTNCGFAMPMHKQCQKQQSSLVWRTKRNQWASKPITNMQQSLLGSAWIIITRVPVWACGFGVQASMELSMEFVQCAYFAALTAPNFTSVAGAHKARFQNERSNMRLQANCHGQNTKFERLFKRSPTDISVWCILHSLEGARWIYLHLVIDQIPSCSLMKRTHAKISYFGGNHPKFWQRWIDHPRNSHLISEDTSKLWHHKNSVLFRLLQ